jgi:hypothetical protein
MRVEPCPFSVSGSAAAARIGGFDAPVENYMGLIRPLRLHVHVKWFSLHKKIRTK